MLQNISSLMQLCGVWRDLFPNDPDIYWLTSKILMPIKTDT